VDARRGLSLFALVLFQVSVGMRWIKLGRRTFVYHKWIAFAIVGAAAVHGLLGIVFLTGMRLF
jgi:uncharacterized membrane protein YcjF (UPF0283 family)